MSDLRQFSPNVQPKFSGAGNPNNAITGARIGDEYRNTDSYELFTCVDPEIPQVWVGSQQGHIPITEANNPNLVAYYTMDNISGSTLVDESSNGNDGTVSGAIQVTGKLGNALSFDGVDDEVVLPSLSGVTGAVGLWVSATSYSVTNNAMIGRADNTIDTEALYLQFTSSGKLRIVKSTPAIPSDLVETTSAVFSADGVMRFYGFQSTGTDWQIYHNGAFQTLTVLSGANTGDWFGDVAGAQPAYLAAARFFGSNLFIAQKQDTVRIFDRALTLSEWDELYNSGLGA